MDLCGYARKGNPPPSGGIERISTLLRGGAGGAGEFAKAVLTTAARKVECHTLPVEGFGEWPRPRKDDTQGEPAGVPPPSHVSGPD
jgi:hypothetical protein